MHGINFVGRQDAAATTKRKLADRRASQTASCPSNQQGDDQLPVSRSKQPQAIQPRAGSNFFGLSRCHLQQEGGG